MTRRGFVAAVLACVGLRPAFRLWPKWLRARVPFDPREWTVETTAGADYASAALVRDSYWLTQRHADGSETSVLCEYDAAAGRHLPTAVSMMTPCTFKLAREESVRGE